MVMDELESQVRPAECNREYVLLRDRLVGPGSERVMAVYARIFVRIMFALLLAGAGFSARQHIEVVHAAGNLVACCTCPGNSCSCTYSDYCPTSPQMPPTVTPPAPSRPPTSQPPAPGPTQPQTPPMLLPGYQPMPSCPLGSTYSAFGVCQSATPLTSPLSVGLGGANCAGASLAQITAGCLPQNGGSSVNLPASVGPPPLPTVIRAPVAPVTASPPAPSVVSSVYCTPAPSAGSGSSCPFLLQVTSGNDIPRISGRESLPPVSIDRSLSGATVTVTLTNNTVENLDLSHTDIVRTAPGLIPAKAHVSSGNVTVQGDKVTHSSFSLATAETAALTFDLQPDSTHTLPSNVLDAIRTVDLTGVDTQTGKLLTELGGKGMPITLRAGWNLVGGPSGTLLNLPPETLYALGSGDTSYRVLTTRQPLQGGSGYLDQLDADRVEYLRMTDPQTVTVPLPAGQYVLIGNPGTTPATVSGADQVLSLDPVTGKYQQLTTLMPGQGAWAESDNGSLVTIANGPESR